MFIFGYVRCFWFLRVVNDYDFIFTSAIVIPQLHVIDLKCRNVLMAIITLIAKMEMLMRSL